MKGVRYYITYNFYKQKIFLLIFSIRSSKFQSSLKKDEHFKYPKWNPTWVVLQCSVLFAVRRSTAMNWSGTPSPSTPFCSRRPSSGPTPRWTYCTSKKSRSICNIHEWAGFHEHTKYTACLWEGIIPDQVYFLQKLGPDSDVSQGFGSQNPNSEYHKKSKRKK